jgi:hypothetical protein
MEWLRNLIAHVETFPEEKISANEPDEEVIVGEKVIGVLSADLQKLYAYKNSLIDQFNKELEAHLKECRNLIESSENCKNFRVSASTLRNEINTLDSIFWTEIWNQTKSKTLSAGIKKGWKIVEIPYEEKSDIGISLIGFSIIG